MKIKDKRIPVAIASVATIAIVLSMISRNDDSILSRAKPLCKTDDWAVPQADYGFYANCNLEQRKLNAHYLWLNDNEIMSFTRTENRIQACRIMLSSTPTELAPVPISGVEITGKPEPISISPDGKSLLWYDYASNPTITPHVSTLDGVQSKIFSSVNWQRYFWSPDSKSLVYTTPTRAGFDIRSVDISRRKTQTLASLKTTTPINPFSELSLPASGNAVFDAYDSKSSSMRFVDCNMKDRTLPLRVSRIKLHKNERAVNSLLSPDGKTLLVTTSHANNNLFEGLKLELTDLFNYGYMYKHNRWHAYSQNGERIELGSYDMFTSPTPPYGPKPRTGIGGVKWTPNSKSISFIHQGTLYLLPVN